MRRTNLHYYLLMLGVVISVNTLMLYANGCKKNMADEIDVTDWQSCLERAQSTPQLGECYRLACMLADPCDSDNGFYRQTAEKEITLHLLAGKIDQAKLLAARHNIVFDTMFRAMFSQLISEEKSEQAADLYHLAPDLLPAIELQRVVNRRLKDIQKPCVVYQYYQTFELGIMHPDHGNLVKYCFTNLVAMDFISTENNLPMLLSLTDGHNLSQAERDLVLTLVCYFKFKHKEFDQARQCIEENNIDKTIIIQMLAAPNPIEYLLARLLL